MNKYLSSTAVFDSTNVYRYRLDRSLKPSGRHITFILLNPSTADKTKDDPTIRRCVGFAKLGQASHLTIVNLFALRSTNPKNLYTHTEPVGKDNDNFIIDACMQADTVIAAWGNHGTLNGRGAAIISMLREERVELHCLGITLQNQPKHPLYLAASTRLRLF